MPNTPSLAPGKLPIPPSDTWVAPLGTYVGHSSRHSTPTGQHVTPYAIEKHTNGHHAEHLGEYPVAEEGHITVQDLLVGCPTPGEDMLLASGGS